METLALLGAKKQPRPKLRGPEEGDRRRRQNEIRQNYTYTFHWRITAGGEKDAVRAIADRCCIFKTEFPQDMALLIKIFRDMVEPIEDEYLPTNNSRARPKSWHPEGTLQRVLNPSLLFFWEKYNDPEHAASSKGRGNFALVHSQKKFCQTEVDATKRKIIRIMPGQDKTRITIRFEWVSQMDS
ncbi:hypothetical protein CPB84DRAFT_1756096 [Gymnopilus junonius]|uniref:Uncharacterized protein n=1 Tax=Gymnopilus junonius TaxID=109634 RepID=A0A9P5N7N8_GYMJU|nr:hypothetical protein CPB84DRAFT_1756096 [Gymnopilus junonius]